MGDPDNALHRMIDASDRASDAARATMLATNDGAADHQAECDAAEAATLRDLLDCLEQQASGPAPNDAQRERWAMASAMNQSQQRQLIASVRREGESNIPASDSQERRYGSSLSGTRAQQAAVCRVKSAKISENQVMVNLRPFRLH